jgi:hypothetical protein
LQGSTNDPSWHKCVLRAHQNWQKKRLKKN